MPRLSQWYVRAALLQLLIGTTIGSLLLAHKGQPFAPGLWRWAPLHGEILLVGWVLQLSLGVAFWIAPRFWDRGRGYRAGAVQAAFFLLNGGVLLVIGGRLLAPGSTLAFWGHLAEVLALVLFMTHFAGRIVGRAG